MAKKKKNKGPSEERKMAKKGIGYVRLLVGVVGFGQGPIRAALESRDGTWDLFPNRTIYYSTGFSPSERSFNQNEAITAFGTYAATALLLKILTWGAKHI